MVIPARSRKDIRCLGNGLKCNFLNPYSVIEQKSHFAGIPVV
jgi:hypothetical protein